MVNGLVEERYCYEVVAVMDVVDEEYYEEDDDAVCFAVVAVVDD